MVKEIEAHVENDHRLLDMLSTIASKFSDMRTDRKLPDCRSGEYEDIGI